MNMQALERYQPYGITLLRVVIGIVFFVHGLQKLFMFGLEGTTGFLASLGVPAAGLMAVLLIATETLGGLALILGLFTRWAAIPLAVVMLVAMFTVHITNGFFVGNNGYEFVLTLFVGNIALVLLGSGALAVDQILAQRKAGAMKQATA
ncbi:MAG: DoxX family protein [Chloroflexaceae bacterium]|nr:DoxX family protein [Chloroflexaceae bacterium]NJL32982.1 DoxX family protein [Chloroflexaceae bacterium]NJO06204.1 DoxX family protein [Chloroflexaceae bacterium]